MERDRFGIPRARDPLQAPDFVRALPPCPAGGGVAIYDADGTLWVDDVADDFTCFMMDRGKIPAENWPTYMRIYRDDHPAGCRYLLTFYQGLTPQQLAAEVDHWWDAHAHRAWIPQVVESLHLLADRGYPIWVVSGTPTDFLLPLRRMLPVSEVVGMDFEVGADGRFTGRHAGISCAGEGKAEKLRHLLGPRPVHFAAGNGSLDGPMMDLAQVAWSVYPNPEFAEHSRARGWPILPRPADFKEEEKFLLQD